MAPTQGPEGLPEADARSQPAQCLERGEILFYPLCPFPLPDGDDRRFLFEQQVGRWPHKNISLDPTTGQISGFLYRNRRQHNRLRDLLASFSHNAVTWLATVLPSYAAAWRLDRVSFRPEEEASRRLRLTARDDLLHIDAYPSRPTHGSRILRLHVNLNPSDPRVWVTSDTFDKLLWRYGSRVGLPPALATWTERLTHGLFGLLKTRGKGRSPYDAFMLRFHHFLKSNDEFQEYCPKRYWQFPPGSAWLVMGDTLSHATLRGRYALDHSIFVASHTLACPERSPAALVARACRTPATSEAA